MNQRLCISRTRIAGLTENRPQAVWALCLLYLCRGLALMMVACFPISRHEPAVPSMILAITAILIAVLLWLTGQRMSMSTLALMAALSSVTSSLVVAVAATNAGVMLISFSYLWTMVYVAHFFSRRVIVAQASLISVGFAVGLAADGLHNVAIAWVAVVAMVWAAGFVLGGVSGNLRRLAATDQLTGLLNRNGLRAAADRERAVADRSGSPLTVVVIDLDDFKQINDAGGHAAGDRLLVKLGLDWRAELRGPEILGRYGGDEFILLLPATNRSGAMALLRRMGAVDGTIRWSAGVSEWHRGETLESTIARADIDLYAAKQRARRRRAGGDHEAVEAPAVIGGGAMHDGREASCARGAYGARGIYGGRSLNRPRPLTGVATEFVAMTAISQA